MATKLKPNAERGGEHLTAQSLTVPAANADNSDWLRLPKPKQRLWGMSRTTWNELLDSGKVKGITLIKGQAKRGIRLIYSPSADSFLKSLMARGEKDSS